MKYIGGIFLIALGIIFIIYGDKKINVGDDGAFLKTISSLNRIGKPSFTKWVYGLGFIFGGIMTMLY
jgi:uncharacterized membrane protein YphA (DoxX/SURF4 family)